MRPAFARACLALLCGITLCWSALRAEAAPLASTEAGGYRLELTATGAPDAAEPSAPAGWELLALDIAIIAIGEPASIEVAPARQAVLLEDGLFPYYPRQDHPEAAALVLPQPLSAGARIEGRLIFQLPAVRGALELRLDLGGTLLALTLPGAGPSVVLDKTSLMPLERLRIGFSGAETLAADAWLGVVPAAIPHGQEAANEAASLATFYLDGAGSGSFVTRAPAAPGAYEVRLHDSDSDGRELLAVGFTVEGPPTPPLAEEPAQPAPAPETEPAEPAPEAPAEAVPEQPASPAPPPEIVLPAGDWAAPGSRMTAHLILHAPLPDSAWIGLVASDVPHGNEDVIDLHELAWQWVANLPDGLWTLTAPAEPGRYDVRVMQDTAGGPDLAWASFTVSPAPPLGDVERLDLNEAINVAQPVFGAYAQGSSDLRFLFDGVPADYRATGYTTSALGQAVVLHLDRAYALELLRFLPWDLDGRTLAWTLEGSLNGDSWEPLAASDGQAPPGWQEVALDGRPWQSLRLTGTASSTDSSYYLVELEAYARLAVPASRLAQPVPAVAWPSRNDLALALWGGRVMAASSGAETAEAAIDGVLNASAWQAAPGDGAPSLVLAFNADAATSIAGLALELGELGRPRLVEVQLSQSADAEDWRRAEVVAVPAEGRLVLATFPAQSAQRVRLAVTARYPDAEPVAIAEVALLEQAAHHSQSILPFYQPGFSGGLNIANYNLAGELLRLSEEQEQGIAWGMLDGRSDDYGWRTAESAFPHQAVVGFYGGQEALIGAVAVAAARPGVPEEMLRRFEIWTSTADPDNGFELAGIYEAEAGGGTQIFAFPPRPARFVMLRALSNWGGPRLTLGEFEVLEVATAARPTILPDSLPPLNDESFGGHMAVAAGLGRWALLTWWYAQGDGPWRSDPGRQAPIDLVFGFGGVGDPWIERIGLRSGSAAAPREDWVKRVKIYVSPDSPLANFTQIDDLTLMQNAELQWFDLPPVQARYLRVRVLENFGGEGFALAELVLPELQSAERLSVLARRYEEASVTPPAAEPPADANERNDVLPLATLLPLDSEAAGLIAPPTDVDLWRVDSGGAAWPGLAVTLIEQPALRIGLKLLDATGATLDTRALYETAGSRAELFWALEPGRYHLAIDRPQSSVVVLSDMSPSTDPVRQEITRALSAFVERVGEFEQIAVAGFCGGIELAADFTNDREMLRRAVDTINRGCGGTDLYGALVQAYDWLEARTGSKAILLITDGAHYGDHEHSLYAAWDRIASGSARIYSIGYGEALYWDVLPYSEERSGLLGQTAGDLLTAWADATGGRYFEAPSGAAIEAVVEQLSRELRQPSHYRLYASTPAGEGRLQLLEVGEAISGLSAARRIEIIFDASGSMWGQIEGRTKIEIARDVIAAVVASLPVESEIALRVYGHRYPSKPKARSCTDSELAVRFAPGNHQRVIDAVSRLKPSGQTPIGLSLAWLSEDFQGLQGHNQVILVTDGIETCDAQPGDRYYPPAIVQHLLELGYEMTVSVVGFDIGESATREFLMSIAETGQGTYFDASNTSELEAALRAAIRAGFEVRDSRDSLVAEGQVGGEALRLPAGVYELVVRSDPPRRVEAVSVTAGRATWVLLDREGEELGITTEEHGLEEQPPSR